MPDNSSIAILLASAARTGTVSSRDQINRDARGAHIIISVSAVVGSPSVIFTIQGKDKASGDYYTLLDSEAITGVGITVLKIYPGATAVANAIASDVLPRVWRVNAVHANVDSITYSVGANVVV